ncbi:MAG TPA: hypothetical protein VLJ62_11565 [Burkholderiaceae bacterium]|nr:hypothetical protein [Burkholderiaceae bacterium]
MNLADERWRQLVLMHGPLGRWRTLPGSHTNLFEEFIEFRVDGSGELYTHSVLRGGDALRFTWRLVNPGVVECQPIYDIPEIGDDGEPEAADWFKLPYVIEEQASDAGSHWVLRERDAAGFWELSAPLVPLEPGAR